MSLLFVQPTPTVLPLAASPPLGASPGASPGKKLGPKPSSFAGLGACAILAFSSRAVKASRKSRIRARAFDVSAQQGVTDRVLAFSSRAVKASRESRIRARAFDVSAQQGVTEPLGFFDPLGFSKGKDEAGFRQLRVAEIKHGRVAMMASVGLVLPHWWKAPGFADVPCGLGSVSTEMGGAGFVVLFLGAGLHELVLWKDDESKDPGDFGDPFKFTESINVDRNYELNNGRMAMFAVLGQVVAELVTGKDAVQQLMS
eukprot:CAMPEP_0197703096 /NCGR_PEP_ID=MMETSP1338-20131121/125266_1 /TAXON_ID=43686 ORGANISM="Pelagodinium beii, Strain RCC1491" /NCGR_SAMPLE_ID=MMETSP1338 /ASSEMBLY_ACC=CAM_ASM_000754 /LENGTH=256 /DNA_ID=CAMNT_0043286989 /DNA_START=68 /DNA_END=839 /DNA_ORIENTATION=-